jgi:hypothetical protein
VWVSTQVVAERTAPAGWQSRELPARPSLPRFVRLACSLPHAGSCYEDSRTQAHAPRPRSSG